MSSLDVHRLGVVPYAEALARQRELVRARQSGEIPDTLLLLEHPPTVTLGSRGADEHLLDADGIEVFRDVGRGGDVTYHGPGQAVAYPIVHLPPEHRDLHRYLRDLEETVIQLLAAHGLAGVRIEGRTGVWVDGAKVAAIGIRASRWVTSHGLALNVRREVMDGFARIVPCGIADAPVTSLEALLGVAPPMDEVMDALEAQLRACVHALC